MDLFKIKEILMMRLSRYEWTIAHCDQCGSNIGWLFTATEKKLQPRSFWGIQTIRLADDMA